MRITHIENKEKLDNFVGSQKHSQFLQSWQWGEFQEKAAGKVWRLGVEENGEIIAAATIVKRNLPMGKSYFFCPRGPVINKLTINNLQLTNLVDLLFEEIKKLAKIEGAMFLRFEPLFNLQPTTYSLQPTIDIQPRKTLILNLEKGKDEILKNMRQKTRYNIRLAEKKGVEIKEIKKDRFEDFWGLMNMTGERDDFSLHGRNYYEAMLDLDAEFIKFFAAEYKSKVIAVGVFAFFGDTAVYMHGGSDNENRDVMAPYLLQWRVISEAIASEKKYYDFYGIDEEKWPGVTRFKKGFGGEEVNYPGTFDSVFDSAWYNIYKMVRKVRRTA